MRNASVLKSGLVGYVYRWLRNAGVVAVAGGAGPLAVNAYHGTYDGRTDATVSALEIACVLTGDSYLTSAFVKDVECGEAESIRSANSKFPFAIREVTYARLSYQSEIGADYAARLSLEALGQANLQRGDTVTILYSRNDPSEVRALPTRAQYKRGGVPLGGGWLMLMVVGLARRAATFESDVGAEVAALERAHAARAKGRR